jgi:hypothetical protein
MFGVKEGADGVGGLPSASSVHRGEESHEFFTRSISESVMADRSRVMIGT